VEPTLILLKIAAFERQFVGSIRFSSVCCAARNPLAKYERPGFKPSAGFHPAPEPPSRRSAAFSFRGSRPFSPQRRRSEGTRRLLCSETGLKERGSVDRDTMFLNSSIWHHPDGEPSRMGLLSTLRRSSNLGDGFSLREGHPFAFGSPSGL